MSIESILTICTGNICRSPLAEALLRSRYPSLRTASAGVGALVGNPADANAVVVAREHGLDVSSHVARQIDSKLVQSHELVLVMEQRQLDWIVRQFPQSRGRVFLAGHWSDDAEVPDPYRMPLEAFRESYSIMANYLEQWHEHLS